MTAAAKFRFRAVDPTQRCRRFLILAPLRAGGFFLQRALKTHGQVVSVGPVLHPCNHALRLGSHHEQFRSYERYFSPRTLFNLQLEPLEIPAWHEPPPKTEVTYDNPQQYIEHVLWWDANLRENTDKKRARPLAYGFLLHDEHLLQLGLREWLSDVSGLTILRLRRHPLLRLASRLQAEQSGVWSVQTKPRAACRGQLQLSTQVIDEFMEQDILREKQIAQALRGKQVRDVPFSWLIRRWPALSFDLADWLQLTPTRLRPLTRAIDERDPYERVEGLSAWARNSRWRDYFQHHELV